MTEKPNAERPRGRRQVLTGTVISNACDKTVTVAVETTVMHRLYQRYMKRTRRFAAHDEHNACAVGDRVTLVACRPLSRRKRWRVREIVQKAGGGR
ncbi:MAG: 30S ribosomal protein S17 [Acidobacteria bacterium]|nr:MAG: 30S ribosomal protein S17 [Acidobacteriota bacterium]